MSPRRGLGLVWTWFAISCMAKLWALSVDPACDDFAGPHRASRGPRMVGLIGPIGMPSTIPRPMLAMDLVRPNGPRDDWSD